MENEIRQEIQFLLHDNEIKLSNQDSLVISGLLSSLNIVELVTWIEKKYKVDFSSFGFNVYDFDTIESIIKLIESRVC